LDLCGTAGAGLSFKLAVQKTNNPLIRAQIIERRKIAFAMQTKKTPHVSMQVETV
jgi:hypothetical protein